MLRVYYKECVAGCVHGFLCCVYLLYGIALSVYEHTEESTPVDIVSVFGCLRTLSVTRNPDRLAY